MKHIEVLEMNISISEEDTASIFRVKINVEYHNLPSNLGHDFWQVFY
jgi:hypothetical protein